MRPKVSRQRIRILSKAVSFGVLGGLIAGCSSGFSRFDTSVYDSATPQQTAAANPYPGNVDQTTTAGISRRLAPMAPVAPKAVPAAVYHPAEPTHAAPQQAYYQPNPATPSAPQPIYQTATRQPLSAQPQPSAPAYQPPPPSLPQSASWRGNGEINRSSLAAPSQQPAYVPPQPTPVAAAPAVQYPRVADPVTTASVGRENGWTSTGGTRITVRSGETLYNISKRYGVPVTALQAANNLKSAEAIQAGQQIVIPNYVYSASAPVSAPDNNPKTRASRAGTGTIGEARMSSVIVPTRRPFQTAGSSALPRYQPVQQGSQQGNFQTPDYSAVTGSVGNAGSGQTYTVQSGDSLSRIGSRFGVSVAALQAHNGLSGPHIKIGQRLAIPGGTGSTQTANLAAQGDQYGVDPFVTGSIAPKSANSARSKISADQSKAPKASGISDFRWPVRGRVVSGFGEKQTGGKNDGIDISVPEGTAVRAAENGVVIYTGEEISMYGKLILVRHENGWVSAYAHNRDFEVSKGDQVRRGQIIARSGRTGQADRPKLHFELRKNSNPVDPAKYLSS